MLFERQRRLAFISLLLAAVCVAQTLNARKPAPAFYSSTPLLTPPGGDVSALLADPLQPNRILLGTPTGMVFVSTDDGKSWSWLSSVSGHDHWVVSHLVADTRHQGRFYASLWSLTSNSGGVFKSDDGGRHWTALLLGHSVRALAVAPSNSDILVAGALDGVFRSTDAGRHWNLISPPHNKELVNIESVAISPRNPNEIYAGTWHLPWKTFDGGRNWIQINHGIIDDSDVFCIAIDPQQPSHVYLSACSGIYGSTSSGIYFQKIQGIPYTARRTRALVQDPGQRQTIFAGTTEGLWRTTDGGASWLRTTIPDLVVNAVVVDPFHPGHVLLGTDHAGVLSSHNNGNSFQACNSGFSNRRVTAMVVNAQTGTRYAAVIGDGRWGGVMRSVDGRAWYQLAQGLQGRDVYHLLLQKGHLIAGTDRGIYLWHSHLPARSRRWSRNFVVTSPRSGAAQWLPAKGFPGLQVLDLARSGDFAFAASQNGLYASDNAGRSWALLPESPWPSFHVTAGGGHVWASGLSFVVRSDDEGRHFDHGLLYLRARINQMRTARGMLFVASSNGLYLSSDGGRHWTVAGHGLPQENISSVHFSPDGIYAVGESDVYCSTDGGQHWQAVRLRKSIAALGPLTRDNDAVWQLSGNVQQTAATALSTAVPQLGTPLPNLKPGAEAR